MRSGKAKIYTDIPDSMLIALAQDAEHFKILQELGLASAMVVPLIARGRTLGAMTFASENPARRYIRLARLTGPGVVLPLPCFAIVVLLTLHDNPRRRSNAKPTSSQS